MLFAISLIVLAILGGILYIMVSIAIDAYEEKKYKDFVKSVMISIGMMIVIIAQIAVVIHHLQHLQ